MKKLKIVIGFTFLWNAATAQQIPLMQQKAMMLTRFLSQQHYAPITWNDSTSAILYERWLNVLDKGSMVFLKSDIDYLLTFKDKLDDELKGASWKFFDESLKLFLLRTNSVDSLLEKFANTKPDFSDNEVFSSGQVQNAPNANAIAKKWEQYIKWKTLSSAVSQVPDSLMRNISTASLERYISDDQLLAAWKKVIKRERRIIALRKEKIAGNAGYIQSFYLNCIAWCYDPHSTYLSLSDKKGFEVELSAQAFSAGIEFEENEQQEKVVSHLQPGGSAWRTGKLHKGDVLVSILKEGIEYLTEDLDLESVQSLLSGNQVTELTLTMRDVAGEQKKVILSTEKIEDEESVVKSFVIEGEKRIGYIDLPGFYTRGDEEPNTSGSNMHGSANDVSKEIVKLKKENISGLILDLRYNGGGSMWEAIQLAGIFIDIGPVASVKDKEGKVSIMKDPNRGTIYDGPLLVLINGASASASEFLSAALQDYHRAVIAGGQSYGKGTAQIILPLDTINPERDLNYQDFVKVTHAKFYRIDGSTVQWNGVTPDIMLPDKFGPLEYKEKNTATALKPDESRKGIYQTLKPLPIDQLRNNSKERVKLSNQFNYYNDFANWYKARNQADEIPISKKKFLEFFFESSASLMLNQQDEKNEKLIKVSNNIFDKSMLENASEISKKINASYMENLEEDAHVHEATLILFDLIK